jgi:hypothetical protein
MWLTRAAGSLTLRLLLVRACSFGVICLGDAQTFALPQSDRAGNLTGSLLDAQRQREPPVLSRTATWGALTPTNAYGTVT